MPKDIKREFLTGPRKLDEIKIIVNEMMADDGPVPKDLGNVGAYDAKTTQGDSDTSNDVSHEDVCAIAWKRYKAGKGAGKKGQNGTGTRHRGKGADEWTSGSRDDGGKKGGKKGNKLDWHGDKDKGGKGKGKEKCKGKSETRYCYDCGEQGHRTVPTSGPVAQTKRTTRSHRGRVSPKERMLKNSRVWRHFMTKESGGGPGGKGSPGGAPLPHRR